MTMVTSSLSGTKIIYTYINELYDDMLTTKKKLTKSLN